MANFLLQNLLFSSKAAEEMFSTVAESVETEAAVSAEPQIETGDGDLESFFGDYAEEQKAADAEAEAAAEAERTRLIRQYASSFRERILKEVSNKDWDKLVKSFSRPSSNEEDLLAKEVANLYNEKISKALPPSWWEKRAPELLGILKGDMGCFEILLTVIRSEVAQKANVRRQAAASNLLKQVKAAAEEIGLSEDEFPHKALSADETEKAAREIGQKCLILAVARAVRKSLLALRECKVRIPKPAEQAFYLITTSRDQKWGVILMALCRLVRSWEQLEQELCARPGAPVEKLKKRFFSLSLEERVIQAAGHCHLNVNEEVDVILRSAGNSNKD